MACRRARATRAVAASGLFAGEPLSDGLIADWRREISNSAVIVNLYGPTETTLAKCFYVVGDELRPGTTLVGSAIPGAQVLVLNDDRACGGARLAIVLRTPYRSRGYLRDTGLDQSCFVTNPATRREDDRLYRTGDLEDSCLTAISKSSAVVISSSRSTAFGWSSGRSKLSFAGRTR